MEDSKKTTRPNIAIPDGSGAAKPNHLNVELTAIDDLRFAERDLKKGAEQRIEIERKFQEREGLVLPVVVDHANTILVGEDRARAALQLGMTHIAVVRVSGLTEACCRKLRLKEAKLSTVGELDRVAVRNEFLELLEIEADFDFEILGFSTAEIDLTFDAGDGETEAEDEAVPEPQTRAVSRLGDIWTVDGHRVICGDACLSDTYTALLNGCSVKAVICDPPYGVKIKGFVSGLGKTKHREFVQGSQGVTKDSLKKLLKRSIRNMRDQCGDGALLYIFMDWRSIELLLAVCRKLGLTLINLCVWTKTSPAMGSMYRSQHELCAVLRVGSASHQNNIELGIHGRSRSNVWQVPGMNSFGKDRMEQLSAHPTPKPSILIEDIIKDCTSRGDIILDGFLGSGTALIAAEKAGRIAYGIELDPLYVDVAIRRFQDRFGKQVVLEASGLTFTEVEVQRLSETQDDADNRPAPINHGGIHGRIRTRKAQTKRCAA